MTKVNDGGPAFPYGSRRYDGGNHYVGTVYAEGMSLRDWFAGQALAGILADPTVTHSDPDALAKAAAHGSYRFADAMIAERSKAGGK